MFSCKENLPESSYEKLGLEEEDKHIKISETHAMLSQIEMKDEYNHIIYPRRSLLTMQSLAMTEIDEKEKDLKLRDVLINPTAICQMDYRTTMRRDYQSPYPAKLKPLLTPLTPPPELWFLNRRTIGYSLHDLENRCGYYKFLDDDMDLHQRIADLKINKKR